MIFRGKSIQRAAIQLVAAFGLLIALDLVLAPPLHRAGELSLEIVDRNGEPLYGFLTEEGRWRFETSLDDIDPVFVERLIAIEDKRFRHHPGIDPFAVFRASASALRSGQITSGASTITMQTARLLEPRPRTLPSKAIEMVRALQIERRLSKNEILELYLTLAPYGGNLEGVRAASLAYFGKEPKYLSNAEQALLLALPQAPEARRPDLRRTAAKSARSSLLAKLARIDLIDASMLDEADSDPLPTSRHAFETMAYHAAYGLSLSAEKGERLRGRFTSSLDKSLQREAEALIRRYAATFDDGATASALVIENQTNQVRALVGSSGVEAPGGWIDLTAATRSPGSTLKPFIYALAFEDGLAGPSTIIDDMPRSFGGYSPENFDKTFRGEVRVREALQHSLNVPAVRMLDRFGAPKFDAVLSAAGVNLRQPKRATSETGLAIALGGAGVKARDIAVLYAGLANGGKVSPLIWAADGEAGKSSAYQLISPQTAQRVSDILAAAPSLEGRAPAVLSRSAVSVAFKTGTSYGFRDAWAAGHGGGYTIVVWTGRADGAPRPGQTGRRVAAPILFDLFDLAARLGDASGGTVQPDSDDDEAPAVMARLDGSEVRKPEIVFPRDGVELFVGDTKRGFSLAARGGHEGYRWYVNGQTLSAEATSGRFVWSPTEPGFYEVTVLDENGGSATAKVRVRRG